jgi:hypothetical protein
MHADAFYSRFASLLALPPNDRHAGLRGLHAATLAEYAGWVQSITDEAAHKAGSDGRSIALVVGHISAWDRFMLQACGEMLSGAAWPGFMDLCGYLDENGERRDFESIDAFNAFHADAQRDRLWGQVQSEALDRAAAACSIFAEPGLLTPERLERTRPTEWGLSGGKRARAPVGWLVWMIILEHEAVEHAADLARAAAAGH